MQLLTTFWGPEAAGPHADSETYEQVRRRRNLKLLVSLLSLGCICVLLLILFTQPFSARELSAGKRGAAAAAIAILIAGGFALGLARRWSVEAGAFTYLCCLTAVITLADTPHEVAAGRSLVIFAVPIFAAGAVLPAWTPFFFAALATLTMLVVGRGEVDPLSYLIACMTFFALAAISWLSASSLARVNAALRAANRSLRQSETDFRLLFADNPLPMVLVDLQTFHIVEANQAVLLQSGYTWQQLLGYTVNKLWNSQFNEALASVQSGETFYEEQEHTTRDGRTVYVAITVHRVVYGEKMVALMIGQDITARRNAEDALRTLNSDLERRVEVRTAELRHANEALERSSRYKDEFLATMSHELRTPLTGILGSAEVLAGEKFGLLNLRQIRAIKLIQESGEHLLGLINSVLDLSKLEAGKLAIDVEPMLARDVCLSALHMVQAQSRAKGQIVTFDCVPDNFWLQADVRRLKQILINLLANAVKFTPENGAVRLEVGANFVEGLATFCVDDNGIGIAAADLGNLFKPFFQINSGLDRLYGGAGLGLALVKRLVELHGGTIDVASTPGQGSRFTITLPCAPKPLTPALPHSSGTFKSSISTLTTVDGRTPHVLLAEDHPGSIEVLTSLLEMAGCSLVIAQRGDEVVAVAEAEQPDLILMDVQMPGMDGLSAMRAIRSLDCAAAHTPIIALTAMALWGDRERCLEAGANEYISKPFSVDHLFETIRQQLGDAKSPAPV